MLVSDIIRKKLENVSNVWVFSAYYGKMPDGFIKDGFSARYRGPDNSQFKEVDKQVLLFHELAIVGLRS